MADSSFDVVSKVDRQEVDNAVNQAAKEVSTRFDFRGVGASIAWSDGKDAVEVVASTEERAKAALEVFRDKVVRRSISLKAIEPSDPRPSGKEFRIRVSIREGITDDNAKKITKLIRDEGPKGVHAQIQGDQVRVSAKKKDDLQAVISLLKESELNIALQFTNYR
jgi:cyclic-di-GMP-binding protein